MPPSSRPWASLVPATALVLALGACGGGEEPSQESAQESSQESAQESAAAVEGTPTPTPTPESNPEPDPAVAAFLERTRNGLGEEGSAHVRMALTGPLKSVAEGDSAYGPDGTEMRLRMSLPEMDGAQLELLVVDDASYMAMPGVTPPGKYFEVPADGSVMGGMTGGLSPADSFAGIEAGLERVEERGRERIDGRPVDRFELHVDSAESMSAMGLGEVPGGLPELLVFDVWLDAEDRMSRVRYELAGVTMTMDMTDWGKPFSVTPPAKKDLVEPPPGM